ncbi:MAG: hypothetical protein EBX03_05435 [Rhodobacteraceae bacterium]|nr:hypothetical protein [Paracoccaceae bacterium]
MKILLLVFSILIGATTMSNASQFVFKSADGGVINLEDFRGKPVLVVNGFSPKWNFNKILIDPSGKVVQTFGSLTRPTSGAITREIEKYLQLELSDQVSG